MKQLILASTLACAPLMASGQTQEDIDKGFLVDLIESNLSSSTRDVSITGFKGALSSAASLDVMTIADADGVWLTLEDVVLDWNRSAVLRGQIDVEELSAARIIITRPPASEPSAPSPEAVGFSLPSLPVGIALGKLAIAEIVLGEAFLGEEISLSLTGNAALSGGEGNAMVTAKRLGDKAGIFSIDGSYSNESRILALDLSVAEDADGIAASILNLPDRPSAELSVSGTAPIDNYTAELTLATNGQNRITGDFSYETDDLGHLINLDIGGDISPLFDPAYQAFFGDDVSLVVSLRNGNSGRVDLQNLTLTSDSLNLSGTAQIGAQGWPERVDLRGQIANDDGDPVLLPLAGPKTFLDTAQFDLQFDQKVSPDWTIDLDVTDFERPGVFIDEINLIGTGILVGGQDDVNGEATANLTYTVAGLQLDDVGAAQALGDTINGVLTAKRTEGSPTQITAFTLSGPGLEARATATIAGPETGLRTQSTVALTVDTLERFSTLAGRPLAGSSAVLISSTVAPLDGTFDIDVTGTTHDLLVGIPQLDAVLSGRGTIAATAERDTDGTRLTDLRIQTSAAKLTGSADLASTGSDATIDISVQDIARIEPRLTGALTATIDAARDVSDQTKVTLRVDGLGTDIDVLADISPTQEISGTVDAVVDNLATFQRLIGQSVSGGLSAQIAGTAMSDFSAFVGTADMQTSNLGVGNAIADLLLAGNGRLSASANLANGTLQIDRLTAETPQMSITGNLGGSNGTGTGAFNARLRDVGILTDQLSGPVTASGTAARPSFGNWQIDATANGPGGINLRADGQVAQSGNLNIDVRGTAPLGLANRVLEPRRITGDAVFDLALNGSPTVDALSGRIDLRNARVTAPTLAQGLSNIVGGIGFANGTARLGITGDVQSGGSVSVTGPVGLNAPQTADIAVALSNVILKDPTLYSTSIGGTLTVKGPLSGGAEIAGQLSLGQTELQVPSSGVGALGDLPDVTHIGASNAVRTTLARAGVTNETNVETAGSIRPFPLDIAINAPSRIFIRGRGLDAELGGTLRIGGTTADVQPIGLFELVRGRIDILQQRFELAEGSASLQGDFEPYIRLVARTEARTGTAISIIVEGPASEPVVSFISTPSLPQDDVLAQLIFGRDLQNISPLQAVQLAAAVGTLAGRGGGGLIDTFRQNIGLDDFDVTTDEDGNAAVRAGKYLSENVYTDVIVSSDGTTEVNINLDITDDFTAKGSVDGDGETSIGIFFEKDY